jgi:hypothetical protein
MARLWLLLGLTVVALGCAARHPAAPEVVLPPAYATVDPDLDAAEPALSGFDPLEEKADVGAGDRVVMGLRIQKNGREQVRFVELTASDPLEYVESVRLTMGKGDEAVMYNSPAVVVHARLLDERGNLIRESDGRSATEFLGTGLLAMARVMHDQAITEALRADPKHWSMEDLSEADRETLRRGFCTLLSFTTAVNKNGSSVFRGLAIDFLGMRGIIEAILGLGAFSVGVKEDPVPGMVMAPGAASMRQAYTVPLVVGVGGTTVMTCRLTVVEPVAPLTLTAGIIAAEAVRAGDPGNRVTMRLVSARRGARE